MDDLLALYASRKAGIEKRLLEFRDVWNMDDRRIFAELAFCICTPQSRARTCWDVVSKLAVNGILYSGTAPQLMRFMKPVRFYRTKARHIVMARKLFGSAGIKCMLPPEDTEAREWLVRNVKGLGYKEASHFLRNAGRTTRLMILDRHILRNLAACGAIAEVPKSMTPKKYMETENAMIEFSGRLGIPPSHL